jgi:CubicO group peptidase (beta-lactamase class C family)
VQGTVFDAVTGRTLQGATVRHASGGTGSAVTDGAGRFQLPSVSIRWKGPPPSAGASGWGILALGSFLSEGQSAYDAAGRLQTPGRAIAQPMIPVPSNATAGAEGEPFSKPPTPAARLASGASVPGSCLLALEAPGYKPREANCTDGGNDTVSLVPETAARYYHRQPVQAGDGWTPGDVRSAFPDPGPLLDLMDSLAARRYREVHSLLVIKGGRLVLEEYYKGNADTIDFGNGIRRVPLGPIHWGRTGKHYIASATKSISGIITGMALEKGGKPVTTPLARILPGYQGRFTGAKADITVEHALTMTLGLEWDEWTGRDLADMWRAGDVGAYALAKPMAAAPGAQWIYNSAGPNLLMASVETLAGSPAERFAAENLFAPLGITDFRWGRQPGGQAEGSARMFMRPRDLAKLGQLCLEGGEWQGRRIVPADWVAASTRTHKSARPKSPYDYGYLWWIRRIRTPKGAEVDYYQAEGDGGQYIVVFPAHDMVLVSTGGNYSDHGTYDSQMVRMLSRHVAPALGL